jgi:HlyD family secretion protein
MDKWLKWTFTLAIIAFSVYWLNRQDPIAVTITHAALGTVEHTVVNTRAGTITACQRARLSLPIGGQIEHIYVQEGDVVEQGQRLLSLWHDDQLARLVENQARLGAVLHTQESTCIGAQKDALDVKRVSALLQQALTAQENLDNAIAQSQASQASCLAGKAQLQAQQAQLDWVKARIEQTQLIAPFSGIIAEITGEVGEYTTPSPPGVATPPAIDLLTHDCHYVSAPIDEVDASSLSLNAEVRISLDAFRHKTLRGKLRRIAPYVQDYEKQARTVTIEVDIDQHQSPHLLTGYSADVEIILAQQNQVLRLRSDLITNKAYVLILNKDNIIERRDISIGLSNWQFTQITQGLTSKDRVIESVGMTGIMPGVYAVVAQDTAPDEQQDNKLSKAIDNTGFGTTGTDL